MRDATLPSLSRRFTHLCAASWRHCHPRPSQEQACRTAMPVVWRTIFQKKKTDMFLQTLGRLRSEPSASSTSSDSTHSPARGSLRSTDTTTPGSSKTLQQQHVRLWSIPEITLTLRQRLAKERSAKEALARHGARLIPQQAAAPYKTIRCAYAGGIHAYGDTKPSVHGSNTTAFAYWREYIYL